MSRMSWIKHYKETIKDLQNLKSVFSTLCDIAHTSEQTIYEYEHPELFAWLKHNTLFEQRQNSSYHELQWTFVDENNEYLHKLLIHNEANVFEILMNCEQGVDMSCTQLMSLRQMYESTDRTVDFETYAHSLYIAPDKHHTQIYSTKFIEALAKERTKNLTKTLERLESEQNKIDESINELKTKLASIDTATALMNIFGLKFSEESLQKVEQWKNKLDKLENSESNTTFYEEYLKYRR